MKVQNVKGGYDFLPKEQRVRNYINGILKKTFEEFSYQPIETPILCYYDILSDKYDEGNDILKEIYKLKDQGNRELGLRYDLTVPFAKLIALNKNKIKFPFKRYEIAKSFRDGPVKVGRDREFTQCDVDVVGIGGQLIEAELLSLYMIAFQRLDIDIIIKYNSRNLMTGLILESGVCSDLVSDVTTIIDKKNKVSVLEFKEMLISVGLNEQQIDKLLNYFNLDVDELSLLFKDNSNEKIQVGLSEIVRLREYLKELEMLDICVFDSSLARGQNYYTGNVFEVYDACGRVSGSIGAGGRYDKMIKEFINDGEEYPTVGISFGLSSIYEIMKDRDIFNDKSDINIYIIPLNTEIESLKLANDLRRLGINVEVEMSSKKVKKCLDYANKEKINYVIVMGEEEINNQYFKLKDMFNNEEDIIYMNDVKKILDLIK